VTRPQFEPFAGDIGLFPVMRQPAGRVDVALLPVGGWDPMLGRRHLNPRGTAKAVARSAPLSPCPSTGAVEVAWRDQLQGEQRG
jgi:hypothetical protein